LDIGLVCFRRFEFTPRLFHFRGGFYFMTTDIQKLWEVVQPIIYTKLAPIQYFEFGEESCKFEKDGKRYEVKIKELKS
jgi:hypothetical protein